MNEVVAQYQAAFAAHGVSPAAQLAPKGRFAQRFGALTRGLPADRPLVLLDYGCGLAYLHDHLKAHHPLVRYVGADAVPEFVASNRTRFPEATFHQATRPDEVPGDFDWVVVSGVFNIDTGPGHEAFVRESLRALFERTRLTLAVDFMTTQVDFQQPTAYHADPFRMAAWCSEHLTRRWSLLADYMPYEYVLQMHAQREVLPGEAVYRA